ncbi:MULTISPECIES: DUF2184 domain-containing protein [unclassified Haematobacter]|uniref:DUF2184 domain-containing protein n=1 Tax=unclassified Haematobacter TaxID=2640585 RepID=UPI0025C50692|nr:MULTISPECIES: major capsid family protein [unclassified Haematobacter]
MNIIQTMDAQAAMAFAISQATRINATVYRTQYPEVRYRGLIPVDTTGPEWVKSVTYFSLDGVGRAEWLNAGADDVPRAEIIRSKMETTVGMAGIGYGWNLEELAQAQMLGINLAESKGIAARRAAEEKIDIVALFGDAEKGFTGLVNNPAVTQIDAAATGTGGSTEWADKDADAILGDVDTALTRVFDDTNTVGLSNTLLMPNSRYSLLNRRMVTPMADKTVLTWLKENNLFTQETGLPLMIRGVRGMETMGEGGTARMVAYRNSPDVLKLNMPMPFRFFPVWQTGPFRFEVPGAFRIGGVDFLLPKEAVYMDGI